jgi:hypothetical protein
MMYAVITLEENFLRRELLALLYIAWLPHQYEYTTNNWAVI